MNSEKNSTGISNLARGTAHRLARVRLTHVALGAVFLLAAAVTVHPPKAWAQPPNPNGMHVYIWSGLKTHGAGQHDYPQFLADWSKVLTEKGAIVDGALHAPSAADLEHTDVVVLYKGDVTLNMSDAEKAVIEAYVKRGGGLVSLHDSLCGPDPAWIANVMFGGGKKHGETNFTLDAPIPLTVVDKASPLMKDFNDITLPDDESFYLMTWAKDPIHVLATTKTADTPSARQGTNHVGEVVPQIWTYEHTLPGGQPARAFVYQEGHTYANFDNPQIKNLLLRGIAWAGNKPVETLVSYVAPAGRGGRGGSGRGGRGFSGGRGGGAPAAAQ
jgi:type 1 glutamine amidotransferase